MRATSVLFLAAGLALAGCQEQSTTSGGASSGTSSSTTSGGGTSATTGTTGSSSVSATTTTPTPPAGFDTSTDKSMEIAAPSGASARLLYKDLKVGDGTIAEAGKVAMVQYTGWLTDGTQFDSSVGQRPLQFRLGEGRVILGWERGIAGMRVGGKRRLVIPPDLGYGAQGMGPIPPNSTLVFEVELLGLQ